MNITNILKFSTSFFLKKKIISIIKLCRFKLINIVILPPSTSHRTRGVETDTCGYPHPTSRVLAPDFGQNCCPDTRPALCRVLPDTRFGYPAPDPAGTRPEFIIIVIIFFVNLFLLFDYPQLVDRYPC